jgi:hypothetical protein
MTPSRIGIAGDVSSGGRKMTATADASSGTSANENNVFDSETARGRLGYAVDNVLLYGTAGLAWANNQYIRTQLAGTFNLATPGKFVATKKGILAALALAAYQNSELYSYSFDPLTRAVGGLLDRAIATREIRDDISPEDLLRALIGMCYMHDQPGWQASVLRLVDCLHRRPAHSARTPLQKSKIKARITV